MNKYLHRTIEIIEKKKSGIKLHNIDTQLLDYLKAIKSIVLLHEGSFHLTMTAKLY